MVHSLGGLKHDADVLTGSVGENGTLVLGNEIEGDNAAVLVDRGLGRDDELASTTPAAGSSSDGVIHLQE